MTAVVANDVNAADLDARSIVGGRAEFYRPRCRDGDEAGEAERAVIQVAWRAREGRAVRAQPGARHSTQVVADIVERLCVKLPARRAKSTDLRVDSVG